MEKKENDKDIKEKELLNKLSSLEKKIIDFLNIKLKVNITGKETNLELCNKKIGNCELMLLTGIQFDSLEYINLSNNQISDIHLLKDFNLKKLQSINLSFNKLNNLNQKKKLDLSFYRVNEIQYNNNINNYSINLDNNGLIEKDIKEIKDIIFNEDYLCYNNNENYQNEIINRINKLEKKILGYFNNKLNINLTGNEIKIDLNNKNIGNNELNLLTGVEFKNLEEINLSHNNISDVEILQYFNNLKTIDLSYNKINTIIPLKKMLMDNLFPHIIEINLDHNNLIKKDIEEIIRLIKNKNILIKMVILYDIKNRNDKIRIFGKQFVSENKNICKMIIDGKRN